MIITYISVTAITIPANTFSSLLICLVTNPSFMILLLGTAAAAGLGQDKPELVSATSQDHKSPASKWAHASLFLISAAHNLHFTCPTHSRLLWGVMLRMVTYIRYPRPLELAPGLGGGTETTETLSPGLEIVE